MKRLLKILAWSVGLLLLLVVVAVISLPLLIDPNDYRDEIGALVKKQTGRELVIEGDLELSVFPWLGVDVGAAHLSNAPGFGPEPFARFERAKVAVKLLPLLLRRDLELGTIELDQPVVHLARDRQGRTNWADLVEGATKAPAEPSRQEPGRAPSALHLGGVALRDGRVTWDDKSANRAAELSGLDLSTGALDLRAPVQLNFDTDFRLNAPQVAGHVSLKGTLHHDQAAQSYSTEALALALEARGKAVPGGEAKLSLTGDLEADLKAQTAALKALRVTAYGAQLTLNATARGIPAAPEGRGAFEIQVTEPKRLVAAFAGQLPGKLDPEQLAGARIASGFQFSLAQGTVSLPELRATALGLTLTGAVQGQGVPDRPKFTGQLQVDPFVPRDLLAKLGVTPPDTADATALSKASLSTRFDLGPEHAALEKVVARLDQSTLTGRIAAQRLAPLQLRYDLALDQMDVDRYLPPPSKTSPEAPATAAAKPLQLPLPTLRALDIDGTLRVGKLQAAQIRATDLLATLRAGNGRFRVHPVGARLYGGLYAGDLGLDVRGEAPLIAMDEKLTGVQLGPLLKDFMGKEYVAGTAQLSAQLTASGTEPARIRRTLDGKGSFSLTDGTVNGINLGQLLRNAYAKYKGQPAPPEEPRNTDFAELRGTFTVNDGLVTNKDLLAQSPLLRVNGQGTANLVTEKVDYRVNTTVVSSFEGQGSLAELKGATIPVRIGGTFTQPRFDVDLAAVLKDQARQALERQWEETKKKQQKSLERQLEDKLKGLLKQK